MSATGEKEGGMGGSDTPRGEYFCSSFHYLVLSFPGSPLSPRRRNILISVTAAHTLPLLPPLLPTSTHPFIHPSIPLSIPLPAVELIETNVKREEEEDIDIQYVRESGGEMQRGCKTEGGTGG